MKVLWLCNMVLPEISDAIGLERNPFGGWLTGAAQYISSFDNIDLAICCPQKMKSNIIEGDIKDKYHYYCFYNDSKCNYEYDLETENVFREILYKYNPDIVHIWGSEYPNALVMSRVNKKGNTLLSIQGICEMYKNHYLVDIPHKIVYRYTVRDLIRRDNLYQQYCNFCKIAELEKETFNNCHAVIGRTEWDKASAQILNSNVIYYNCNETLRDSFYSNEWSIDKCEKHTIFVSQWNYPIKGFHNLLKAMPLVLRRYPDAKIYTTGVSPFDMPIYRLTSYQKYIKELILKYSLKDNVCFLGVLNEQQMCDRYLKSNVFVSPSSIENSPNSVGEAMLLGMPIVASFVGGTQDMLKDKEEGFLYQKDAFYMLSEYICRFFDDDLVASIMGRKARNHALKTHDREKNADDLYSIYLNFFARNN